jgi:type I restriction enzyme S subunit
MAGNMADNSTRRSWLYHPEFPEHWTRQPLYSLAAWVNGLAFRNIQFSADGMPVIKIAEIKGGITGQTKFTQQVFDESVRVKHGDMLFSWSGQPETSIDVFWWYGPEGWLNQHVFRVTPAECVDRAFFYYLLRYLNPNFVGIASNKQTTGLGHVTKRDLDNIEVAYPGIREQQAIACILGALDEKIELNRRMNRTLEATSRAIFKSWFVDFDPVRAKAAGQQPPGLKPEIAALFPDSFEDSELGEIPMGWRVGLFGTIAQEVRDAVSPSEIEADCPYIALEHIPKRCIALDSWGVADEVASGKLRFRRGDILFGKLRPYFHKVGPAPIDGVCSTDIVVAPPERILVWVFGWSYD